MYLTNFAFQMICVRILLEDVHFCLKLKHFNALIRPMSACYIRIVSLYMRVHTKDFGHFQLDMNMNMNKCEKTFCVILMMLIGAASEIAKM